MSAGSCEELGNAVVNIRDFYKNSLQQDVYEEHASSAGWIGIDIDDDEMLREVACDVEGRVTFTSFKTYA